jgi:hypothetical protein
MLSPKAKHLSIAGQILRCDQNDSEAYARSTGIGPEMVPTLNRTPRKTRG